MSEQDNNLPYTTEEHDNLVKNTEQIKELSKKVEDLSVLKENVIQLTALEKHLVDDASLRVEQHEEMMKDNSKQWSSIATLTMKLDQSISAQTDFMKNVDIRLDKMEKDIGSVKTQVSDVKIQMGAINDATDIKKARITAIGTSIAALLAAIAAIIVALIPMIRG
jgi:chromosome segregation ATPase